MKIKKRRKYCGLELYMLMERDFDKAKKDGSFKAIDDFIKEWGGFWIEEVEEQKGGNGK